MMKIAKRVFRLVIVSFLATVVLGNVVQANDLPVRGDFWTSTVGEVGVWIKAPRIKYGQDYLPIAADAESGEKACSAIGLKYKTHESYETEVPADVPIAARSAFKQTREGAAIVQTKSWMSNVTCLGNTSHLR